MTEPRPTTESEIVDFVRAIDVPAPDSLHREVEALIAGRSSRAGRRRGGGERHEGSDAQAARPRTGGRFSLGPRLAAGGAFAVVLVAVVVAISVNGSNSSTLSVKDASTLTLSTATSGPPSESRASHTELAADVEGVPFPYWGRHFGWRSTGERTDRIDGRTVRTVFYENSRGRRVGYSIVAGNHPPQSSGGVVSRRDGTLYRLSTENGASVVSWLRGGHLCVVSGHGVDGATLLRLASWDDHDSISS